MLSRPDKHPIIQIEDDPDDQFLVRQALDNLSIPYPIRLFTNGQDALNYLKVMDEQPLVILCDINMPLMNGLELRDRIEADEHLRKKAIPFIFFTTSASRELVNKAYERTIQGFHQKESQFGALERQLALIIHYWQNCLHPNSF